MVRSQNRKGTSSVELAVCLPLIVLFVFGGIETVNAIFLKQGLTIAAYETVKVASSAGKTEDDGKAYGNQILSDRGFVSGVISVSPTVDETTPRGTVIKVTATAPASENSVAPMFYYDGATIRAEVSMVRN